jgi:hypothetical protein
MLMAFFPTPELIEDTTPFYKSQRLAHTRSGSICHPIKTLRLPHLFPFLIPGPFLNVRGSKSRSK